MLEHAAIVTVNRLPLHPLIVHATVVALPLTAVLALIYVYRANGRRRLQPRDDGRLRLTVLVLALVSVALVWVTRFTGVQLRDTMGMPQMLVHNHQVWGDRLAWATTAFAVVAVVVGFRDQQSDWLRGLLHGLLVVGAATVIVFCVLTGDAGARLVYGSVVH